ncbi:MAG: hypothetical protein P8Y91_11270, partial [Desulfuromonadales bacterium]
SMADMTSLGIAPAVFICQTIYFSAVTCYACLSYVIVTSEPRQEQQHHETARNQALVDVEVQDSAEPATSHLKAPVGAGPPLPAS